MFQMFIHPCISWNSLYLDYLFHILFDLFKYNELYMCSVEILVILSCIFSHIWCEANDEIINELEKYLNLLQF